LSRALPTPERKRSLGLEIVVVHPSRIVVRRGHDRSAAVRPIGIPRSRNDAVAFIECSATGITTPTASAGAAAEMWCAAAFRIALGTELDPETAKIADPAEPAVG